MLESWSGMKIASSSWEAARECGAQHLCLPVGDALRSNEGKLPLRRLHVSTEYVESAPRLGAHEPSAG